MSKKILPVLFATLLIDMIGVGMIFPIIPVLFTDPVSPSFMLHGYSQSMQFFIAGLITSLFGIVTFISAPIFGELSDVYGRKRLLTVGVGVLAISQLFFGFGIELRSIALLLFSRIVAGFAAANFSIAQASIADITEPKDRAKNFGIIGGAFGIGFIIGPILGGWIASWAQNAAAPFWAATALGIFNVLFLTLFFEETKKRDLQTERKFTLLKGVHNIRTALRDVDARPVYIASFLYFSGFSFFVSFIGVLLVIRYGFSAGNVGTFFGIVGAWIVITQMVILRIVARKYSETTILRYSMLCVAAALAAYPFMPNTVFLYILVPFMAIPQGLSMANLMALVSKGVSPDKQGTALGINGSLGALAQGIIPIVAGVGSGSVGIQAPFIAGSICIILSWFTLFRLKK